MNRIVLLFIAFVLFAACGKKAAVTPDNSKTAPKISTTKVSVSVNYNFMPYDVLVEEGDSAITGNSDSLHYHPYVHSWYPHVGAVINILVDYSILYKPNPNIFVLDGADSIPVIYSVIGIGEPGILYTSKFTAK